MWRLVLAASPVDQVVSLINKDNTIRIWDVRSGVELVRLDGHEGRITSLAALPDGRLASGSDDKTIRIWDVRNRTGTGPAGGA